LKTENWLCVAALLALPGLAGCGGSSSSGTNSPILTPRSVSTILSDGLTATLAEDRTAVSVGGTVNYTLTLTNPTAQPITYQPALSGTFFSNAPAYLGITDPSGKTAFPVGPFANFGGIGPGTTLAPGQSASGTVAVGSSGEGGYSAAGTYTAAASFAVYPGASGGTEVTATTGPLIVTAQ